VLQVAPALFSEELGVGVAVNESMCLGIVAAYAKVARYSFPIANAFLMMTISVFVSAKPV